MIAFSHTVATCRTAGFASVSTDPYCETDSRPSAPNFTCRRRFRPRCLRRLRKPQPIGARRCSTAPDQTDVPYLTIDPPGSMDLDQAMHIARNGAGYRVQYAIADVAAFVSPGDPVDVEAHVRGETLYSPDMRTPLHPPAIGEGAASLLPDQIRPALVWTIDLDADGRQTAVDVKRAVVRSVSRLNYSQAQQLIDAGTGAGAADGTLALLAEVGRLSASARGRARRREPTAPRARGGRRRVGLSVALSRAVAGRGLERADLAAHRHGSGRHHARRERRHPSHAAASRRGRDRIAAPRGARTRRRMAETPDVRHLCVHSIPRPTPALR